MTDQPVPDLTPPTAEEQAEIIRITDSVQTIFEGNDAFIVMSACTTIIVNIAAQVAPPARAEVIANLEMLKAMVLAMKDLPHEEAHAAARAVIPDQCFDAPGDPQITRH